MEILVCIKWVPDTSGNEIEPNSAGDDIQREDLVYSLNEWDSYAIEEAIQIVERIGGTVTVATVGGKESEEALRRAMAMSAHRALLLTGDGVVGALDGHGIAAMLRAAVEKGSYDLILTGAQADDGAAQVGGMLAAMLDYPYASLVDKIEIEDERTLIISREIEGGSQELSRIELPCVLSIQTGINEPRYVGVRGMRKVASVEAPKLGPADLGLDASTLTARTKRIVYFVPEKGEGPEMLEGSNEEIIPKLLEILKAKGGLN